MVHILDGLRSYTIRRDGTRQYDTLSSITITEVTYRENPNLQSLGQSGDRCTERKNLFKILED